MPLLFQNLNRLRAVEQDAHDTDRRLHDSLTKPHKGSKHMSLTQKVIEKITTAGTYQDRYGLMLKVTKSLTKNWVMRYQINRKRRDMGLGSFPAVSLADARKVVMEKRALILKGIDPLDENAQKDRQVPTFEDEALARIEKYRHGWSAKHTEQWVASLTDYAFPKIGKMQVSDIDTDSVVQVLEPIWQDKNETARRLRNRIELILDFAKARGWREENESNPARWHGHLNNILTRAKPAKVPLESMPYDHLPAFMAQLDGDDSRQARCMQFLILTGARTSEAMGARWDEIDFIENVWCIPAARMKSRQDHKVPLTEQALQVLKDTHTRGKTELIFPGKYSTEMMASNALRRLLAKYDEPYTTHGFRSTFRTWAADKTKYSPELCEMALAHSVGTTTERSYNRTTQLEKRRKLMESWAGFASSKIGHRPVVATKSKNRFDRATKVVNSRLNAGF